MSTQKPTQTEVKTLTAINGDKFPRIPVFARKIYFSPETIFFNIPTTKLNIVEIKDYEKVDGEFFNTAKVFMTVDGVVHENVLMASVWNIQQAKELTIEQRSGYMYNAELNAFAFLRGGRIQMLPMNGRHVVDVNGDTLLDLDEILSDIESLIDVPKEEKKVESQPEQSVLDLPQADWKNTENYVEVLLAKLIGPIGNVYTTNDFRLDAANGLLAINDFSVDFNSKDPLFAVLTEHMHLQKVSALLNQNFASLPSIGQISVYDLYGGVSIIFTPGFIALVSKQLAKELYAKKDKEDLKVDNKANATMRLPNFTVGSWTVYTISGGFITFHPVNRAICKNGLRLAEFEPTEMLARTTLDELRNVGVILPVGNIALSDGHMTYLYDLTERQVHANINSEVNDLLSHIGCVATPCGFIRGGIYTPYGTVNNSGYMSGNSNFGNMPRSYEPHRAYSEELAAARWADNGPALNFGNITPANAEFNPWHAHSTQPQTSGTQYRQMRATYKSVAVEVSEIVKSITLTDLTNDDIKTIMAALITKL